MSITLVGIPAMIVFVDRALSLLSYAATIQQETLKKANLKKARELLREQISERERWREIESRKPLETRIASYLKKYEGVRFTEAELRKKVIFNSRDKVDFYVALLAVVYWQQRNGFGFEVDYANNKKGERLYFYEKSKKQDSFN